MSMADDADDVSFLAVGRASVAASASVMCCTVKDQELGVVQCALMWK